MTYGQFSFCRQRALVRLPEGLIRARAEVDGNEYLLESVHRFSLTRLLASIARVLIGSGGA
jgi:hypothetical protein